MKFLLFVFVLSTASFSVSSYAKTQAECGWLRKLFGLCKEERAKKPETKKPEENNNANNSRPAQPTQPWNSFNYYAGEVTQGENGQAAFKEGTDVRSKLHWIMNQPHIVEEGKLDEISEESTCAETRTHADRCREREGLGYRRARQKLFGEIHLKGDSVENYKVKDVYCLHEFTADDYRGYPGERILGPNVAPWHEVFNAEHVWPQSRFLYKDGRYSKDKNDKGEMKKGDMHILYPSHHGLNSLRSNYHFGVVVKPAKPKKDQELNDYDKKVNKIEENCKTGNFGGNFKGDGEAQEAKCALERKCFDKENVKLGYAYNLDGETVDRETLRFEPPNESKGKVARAVFYFATLHNLPIEDIEEQALRAWNKKYAPDEEEKHRNEEIYKVQNIRNPYIDYPELVDQVSDF